MKKLTASLLTIALLVTSPVGMSHTPASSIERATPGPTIVEDAYQLDFKSNINGEVYRLRIYKPEKPAPPQGFPTVYVLDGNILFTTFAAAVRNRSQAGEIESALVVGISGGDGKHAMDRTFDFTSADLTLEEKELVKERGTPSRFGGSANFLRVLQNEVKPKIASLAKVDPTRDTLFGWSLGGLFVMQTLFEHPGDFQTFVALSPSLWRSGREIFGEVPAFDSVLAPNHDRPRLFMGGGSTEEEAPAGLTADGLSHDQLVVELHYSRMTSNVIEMATLLKPIFVSHQLDFETQIFAGESHNSVPWAALNSVLNFALRQKTPAPS